MAVEALKLSTKVQIGTLVSAKILNKRNLAINSPSDDDILIIIGFG